MDNFEMQERIKAVKAKIEKLIEAGRLSEAKTALNKYDGKIPGDPDICSMQAVILMMEGSLDEAESVLLEGLNIDTIQFDLVFNLAYIYELRGQYQKAADLYSKAGSVAISDEQKQNVNLAIDKLKKADVAITVKDRLKLVFFVKEGMDGFLGDVITGISDEYWARKIIVSDFKQIDAGMNWADICWFEWCDELVAYGSTLLIAREKKIICRLHSYEAFSDNIANVDWTSIDKLIFVARHIMDFVLEKQPLIKLEQAMVIANGVDIDKYSSRRKQKGFNIAYAGYINYKKGPMLLLHTFKALYDMDKHYKLHIAGVFQDYRDQLYFNQMIKEFGIENNIFFDGWQDNLNQWLDDKDYILCTSVLESQNMSVMQAMCKGIKPIVHNFVGAKGIYPEKYVWNTIDEAVQMISDNDYNSEEYRKYIEDNYSYIDKIHHIKELIFNLSQNVNIKQRYRNPVQDSSKLPLVTIGITNYNGKQYIENCVKAFLNQTYPNIEILLIDDCSTDGSKEIIEDLESTRANIRAIYHDVNSGGATTGIREIFSEARGKYVQWIACDDYVSDKAVEMFVEYLENNPNKDYVFSHFDIINENGESTGKWIYNLYSSQEAVCRIFNTSSGVIPMNCMFRISFFRQRDLNWIIYKGNDFSSDTLNSLAFIKAGMNYGMINECLINYRIHSQNASHNLRKRVVTSLSVHDFVIRNFDEDFYLPNIEWSKVNNRPQYKNLVLAQFYFLQIEDFLNFRNIPAYIKHQTTRTEMLDYLKVFIDEGLKYIEEGLKQGNDYKTELLLVKEKYTSLNNSSMKPVISIGIFTYNRAERLNKCLNSIFSQIGNDDRFEVVVSDNDSNDDTSVVVDRYMSRFGNLRYYKNDTNIGAEENLFNVLDKSQGEYLFPHGDDDYFKEGTLYELLSCVENNRSCSLIYINVLQDNGNSYVVRGMDEYIKQASIYSTFASSFLMKKSDYDKVRDKKKFIGSSIPHLYFILAILEINPIFLMYCRKIYDQEIDQSPGGYIYSFAHAMIKSYFDILASYVGKGLSMQIITDEKRKLVGRSLWYYEMGLKKRDTKLLKDFEKIFADYYKDEPYFDEVYKKMLEIKQNYA